MQEFISFGKFLKDYSNDSACLEELKQLRFPNGITCKKCNTITKHYKLKTRPAYCCKFCRTQTYPLVGTIFERTKIPLTSWFYAIFVMTKTRSGISAKQLQRELGVTYNTAWSMFKQLRMIMEQPSKVKGTVEVDETFVGGKGYNRGKIWWANWEEHPKQIVMGMVERKGRVCAKHIPNTGKYTLLQQIKDHVDQDAHVMTDDYHGYIQLKYHGYKHDSVTHKTKYVDGDIYTQNIENFWSHFKRGITGVYRHVSPKYLQSYVNEFAWRYNHREEPEKMFKILLKQALAGFSF